MSEFHFLRPEWFWALLPLVALLLLMLLKKRNQANWRTVIDPQLMPHVLIGKTGQTRKWPLIALALGGLIGITALAGPSWERLPTPVFRSQSALAIGLDLSLSMDSTDLKPSRLIRARLKIADILKQRREGQTALIVFSADAFTITPLTDDTDTINAQLSSLSTTIMPTQGSRPDTAIRKAIDLFQQASVKNGTVLLLTDGGELSELEDATKTLVDTGHRLSILGIGTDEGAPIAKPGGGFVTDRNGSIVIPKLNEMPLRNLALKGGGRYRGIAADDSDILYLLNDQNKHFTETASTDIKTDHWREEGPWLVLLLLPLAALAFRRGFLCLLLVLLLPLPQPAHAFSWNELWLNADQRGEKAYQQEQHAKAAELFQDPHWKASALFRAGEYEKSIEALQDIETADAFYNKGNALAKLGKIPEAIASYEKTLTLTPKHEDAKYNLDLLKKLQQQQKDSKQNQPNQSEQDQSQTDKSQPDQSQQDQAKQDQPGQDAPQQDQSQQNQTAQNQAEEDQSGSNSSTEQKNQTDTENDQALAAEKEKQEDQEPKNQADQAQNDEAQDMPEDKAQFASPNLKDAPMSEEQQATEQWLRRIPDDPGGLLRRKFRYQYSQGNHQQQEQEPW